MASPGTLSSSLRTLADEMRLVKDRMGHTLLRAESAQRHAADLLAAGLPEALAAAHAAVEAASQAGSASIAANDRAAVLLSDAVPVLSAVPTAAAAEVERLLCENASLEEQLEEYRAGLERIMDKVREQSAELAVQRARTERMEELERQLAQERAACDAARAEAADMGLKNTRMLAVMRAAAAVPEGDDEDEALSKQLWRERAENAQLRAIVLEMSGEATDVDGEELDVSAAEAAQLMHGSLGS
jgi:hypothetical protein